MLPSTSGSARRNSQCDATRVFPGYSLPDFISDHDENPFLLLGMMSGEEGITVRAWIPDASRVWLRDKKNQRRVIELRTGDIPGLFTAHLKRRRKMFDYAFEVLAHGKNGVFEDPYRFGNALKTRLIRERSTEPLCMYTVSEPKPMTLDGVPGTCFSVRTAARQVSICGRFDEICYSAYPMRLDKQSGIWSLFIPGTVPDAPHTYRLRHQNNRVSTLAEPLPFRPGRQEGWSGQIPPSFSPPRGTVVSVVSRKFTFAIFVLHIDMIHHYFSPSGCVREDFLPNLIKGGITHLAVIPDAPLLRELYPFSKSGPDTECEHHTLPEKYFQMVKQAQEAGLSIVLFPGWVLSSSDILLTEAQSAGAIQERLHCKRIPDHVRQHCLYSNLRAWLHYFNAAGLYDGNSLMLLDPQAQPAMSALKTAKLLPNASGRSACPVATLQETGLAGDPPSGRARTTSIMQIQICQRWRHFACSALFNSSSATSASFQELVEQLFRQRTPDILLPFTHEIMYSPEVSDGQRRAYSAIMWACPGDKIFAGPTRKASEPQFLFPDAFLTQLLKDLNDWNRKLSLRESFLRCWHQVQNDRNGIVAFSLSVVRHATLVIVTNTSGDTYFDCVLEVADAGDYLEILNTDSAYYGGDNVGNAGKVITGQQTDRAGYLLTLTVPASSTVYLLHGGAISEA